MLAANRGRNARRSVELLEGVVSVRTAAVRAGGDA
jgi:hypothetical protein